MVARVCFNSDDFRAIAEMRVRVWVCVCVWFWKALEEERGGGEVGLDRLAWGRPLMVWGARY